MAVARWRITSSTGCDRPPPGRPRRARGTAAPGSRGSAALSYPERQRDEVVDDVKQATDPRDHAGHELERGFGNEPLGLGGQPGSEDRRAGHEETEGPLRRIVTAGEGGHDHHVREQADE